MSDRSLALLQATLLPRRDDADSVLVRGGRIARIGPAREVLAAAPPDTETVDLAGRTLSPGFHDAHFHFLQTGLKSAHPSLDGCRSLGDVLDAVREAVTRFPDREPLLLEAWDETQWERPSIPTRAELDRVAPERAVVLRRIDDHTAVANGRAVRLLREVWKGEGIDPDSGLCREDPVLLLEELFPPGEEEIHRAFREAARLCFSLGITTACDFLRPSACRAYASHFAGAGPTPHIDAYVWADCLDERGLTEALPEADSFRWRGVKAWADGSVGARAAALFEEYADRPGERGRLFYSDDELRALVRRGHQAGLGVAIHAIGDRAIAQVLDAFAVLPPEEIAERRHRIEHFELPRPPDIDRAAALGVRPCVQPNFVGQWAGPGGLYETALGADRLRTMNPLRTLLRRGTGLFFGSDGMPASPRYGIRSAMTHPVPEQRLSLDEAHRLYTEEPARALDPEPRAGQLEVGSRADLVVLPVVPARIVEEGSDVVDLTMLAGQVVHSA